MTRAGAASSPGCCRAAGARLQGARSRRLRSLPRRRRRDRGPDGQPLISGRNELTEYYGRLFTKHPDLSAEIITRIRVGSHVIDDERVTGGPRGDVHAVAIYRLNGAGHIGRVRLLR